MKVKHNGVVVEFPEEECFTIIKAVDFFENMLDDCLTTADREELREKYGDGQTGHVNDLVKKMSELREALDESCDFYWT